MSIPKAIATIVGCTVLLAGIGASFGYALGAFAPGYYRSVFRAGREPDFDPVDVGVGLGVTQGMTWGVVVGLAVVALLCWRERRCGRSVVPDIQSGQPAASRYVARAILLIIGVLPILVCSGGVSYILGLFHGEHDAYHLHYLEEQQVLAPVLAGDPAFAGERIVERPEGGAYLFGQVPTQADADRLRAAVADALGDARAKSTVQVEVRNRDQQDH
jgi:hypothetical protein